MLGKSIQNCSISMTKKLIRKQKLKRCILGQVTLAAVTNNSKIPMALHNKNSYLADMTIQSRSTGYSPPSSYSGIQTSFMLEFHHLHVETSRSHWYLLLTD